MTLVETLSAIKTFWPIVVLVGAYEIGAIIWRVLVWRSLQAILSSGLRLERIVLNHKHAAKTQAVIVDAAGVSGSWDGGSHAPKAGGAR